MDCDWTVALDWARAIARPQTPLAPSAKMCSIRSIFLACRAPCHLHHPATQPDLSESCAPSRWKLSCKASTTNHRWTTTIRFTRTRTRRKCLSRDFGNGSDCPRWTQRCLGQVPPRKKHGCEQHRWTDFFTIWLLMPAKTQFLWISPTYRPRTVRINRHCLPTRTPHHLDLTHRCQKPPGLT